MKEFFLYLRKQNLKLSHSKPNIGATDANFLGHTISPAGIMPNAQVEALIKMPSMDLSRDRLLVCRDASGFAHQVPHAKRLADASKM